MNVLIVDDHSAMRAMIRSLIDELVANLPGQPPCRIRECTSGEEAVALCTAYVPDFVTMDLRMTGMPGLTCIQQLRALLPAAQIAVVTQFDNDASRARAKQVGANVYITKDDLAPLCHYVQQLSTSLPS